ncbi:TIGR01777 family oxidoreductase [Citricoccus sp. NR2]|uniref:TIGR01777 family oxidoreductase n=1 Tax=Citricoccus sp. NR2 TaxID=3004095 RepID=UPI0022DCF8C8|nr:TIGR01777 family oxidoreductase [Citricoccus sp. NR2]WBL17797.1 TIGR01777 family oxidoreductase [Citricoccus sp. NR2]
MSADSPRRHLFEHMITVPHSRETVAAWHERGGVLPRLSPDWSTTVLQEPDQGLHPGSRARLLMGPAGLVSLLPSARLARRAGVRWEALHTAWEPGHGFTDVMESGPLRSWTHQHGFVDDEPEASCRIEDRIEYELPAAIESIPGAAARFDAELERIMAFRSRVMRDDLDFQARVATDHPLTVAITGASGLVGTQVSALLRSGGHRVITLVRHSGPSRRIDEHHISWDPAQGELDASLLIGVDAVINLSGASIAGPFTAAHRRTVFASRVDSTSTLVTALRSVADRGGPHTLISASASGFYGHDASAHDEDAAHLDETAPSGDGFLAAVCRQWEQVASGAAEAGIRVVTVRTGLVLSSTGGLLAAQLPLYQAGAGGPMGSGGMWQPWVSLDDLAQIYVWAVVRPEVTGPVNAVSPQPVQQREFAATLGDILHRPTVLRTPNIAPAVLLGRQGARELALSSARLAPAELERSGYRFRHPDLTSALRHTLGR